MPELLVGNEKNVLKSNQMSFDERKQQLEQEDKIIEAQREREKKSTFNDFAQLNRKNIAHLIAACNADKQALRLLLFMIEKMDNFNALICSYKVFEEQLNISKATITRAIKYLKDNGFLHIKKTGTANVYILNDDLVWRNSGDKHQYCQFPANVILSAAEQPELAKNLKAPYQHVKIMKSTEDKSQEEKV